MRYMQSKPIYARTFTKNRRGGLYAEGAYLRISTVGYEVASSPGRFIFLSNYAGGRKNGLVFIARVIVRMRYSITQILGNRILQ